MVWPGGEKTVARGMERRKELGIFKGKSWQWDLDVERSKKEGRIKAGPHFLPLMVVLVKSSFWKWGGVGRKRPLYSASGRRAGST